LGSRESYDIFNTETFCGKFICLFKAYTKKGDYMRLFTAINFNEEIKNSIFNCILRLKDKALKGNFTRRENLHLTVVFIGETNRVDAVKSALDGIQETPFKLTIGGMGKFKRNGGDIYWVGVDPNPTLTNIYHQLRKELLRREFIVDNRPYRPHLTLGREVVFPENYHREMEEEFAKSIPKIITQVDSLSLMKSERINGKLTYTEIYRKPL
jgi:2'-5' RNA ligase